MAQPTLRKACGGCWTWKGWLLTPEGAAICEAEGTAVIADVHLGYEWARAAGGDCLPAHSLRETLAKLDRLVTRRPFHRLIVAGDLVESPRPCPRTAADLAQLQSWLADRNIDLITLQGNHDPLRVPRLPETLEVAGWMIGHGHRPLSGSRIMIGHDHPVLRLAEVCAPCFLLGDAMIVLPAFSENAAGLDVRSFSPPAGRAEPLRCVASSGEALFDFGVVATMKRRSRRPSRAIR